MRATSDDPKDSVTRTFKAFVEDGKLRLEKV